jgi:predicted transcriptional regulator
MNMMEEIKEAVNAGAITRRDLARDSGVNQRTIYNILNGVCSPRFDTLEKLHAVVKSVKENEPAA